MLLLLAAGAHAQDRAAELERRADAIENDRGADAASDALSHARRALGAARHAPTPEARARALDIAEAAVTLADRLAARARARVALAQVQAQLREAETRSRAAREALEHAMQERARLAEALRTAQAPPPPPAPEGE
jgi:hypothetical protein